MGWADMSIRKPKLLDASFLARKGRASTEGFNDPNAARVPPPAEYSEPEAPEPEVMEPEAPESEAMESEAMEPEETEPDIAESERGNYWIKTADEIPRARRRDGGVPAAERKTVLIVEDDPQNMNLFDELLQIHGCETVRATSGWEALDRARECRPDLILLDIQLPDIPGTEVAALLKGDADLSHIPVIAISAFVADGLEDEAFEAGCEAFVTKPITMAGFLETVEEFLG